jgi:hypothetical protein
MPPLVPSHGPSQLLQQHPPPDCAPVAGFLPFFNLYSSMSSPSTPATSNANADETATRTQSKSRQEYNLQLSPRTLWPNYSPGYSVLPAQIEKQSRLPPNSIGRKMPRKAAPNSPHPENSPHSSIARSKIVQRRASKKTSRLAHEAPVLATRGQGLEVDAVRPTRLGLPLPATPHNVPKHQTRLSARSRRPVTQDEDDEESEDNSQDVPCRTIETGGTPDPNAVTDSPFAQIKNKPRLRPRFDYVIPKALKGVHQALGEDNWNDYMILMEHKFLGEIDEAQLTAKAAPIFTMFEGLGRQKMERQIVETVVKPVLDQHKEVEM